MGIEIFLGYPPDRESPQAELSVRHNGTVDIPAYVRRRDGELIVELFSKQGGEPEWTYPVDEFIDALERAVAAVNS